jgi:hypothetical protein
MWPAKATAHPTVMTSPRFTTALGFTSSHNPTVAIVVGAITRRSNRRNMRGTIMTYRAVKNALFEAVV